MRIAQGHDATSSANNQRTVGASIGNNERSTSTQRDIATGRNQTQLTIAEGNQNTRLRTSRRIRALPNEAVAVGPHGEKLVVRNGQWVPAQ
jgi:hypothetical protein